MRLLPSVSSPGRDDQDTPKARLVTCKPVFRLVPSPEFCLAATVIFLIATFVTLSGGPTSEQETLRKELNIHSGRIEGLAFSSDGRTAASASRDGTVMLWDVVTRRESGLIMRGAAGFTSVAFAPNGHVLATGGLDGMLTVRDTKTMKELLSRRVCFNGGIRAVTFSPDGASVATGSDDHLVRVWDLASGQVKLELRGHAETVDGLAFAPDGQVLGSVSLDGRGILWDLRSGQIREQFQSEAGPLWSIAFAPDGRSLAVGGTQGISLRDLNTGRMRSWPSQQGPVTTVRYLPDGHTLATSSLHGALILWNVARESIDIRCRLDGQRSRVKSMGVSPDGMTLVTGADDAVLRFWDLSQRQPEHRERETVAYLDKN